MLIVLPNAKNGLPALLESLTSNADMFAGVLAADRFHAADVVLQLPVFSIEGATIPLRTVLSNLGLGSIFNDGTADLSGMNGERDLYVDSITHKALIDVRLCNYYLYWYLVSRLLWFYSMCLFFAFRF